MYASHVLRTAPDRVRFASVGALDVLEHESRKSVEELQKEDMYKLGHLMVTIALRQSITSREGLQLQFDVMRERLSADLCLVVGNLLVGKIASARQLTELAAVASHSVDELDASMATCDIFHEYLRREYENGRLMRLLLKLGCINERPEYALDPQWSETGDRYILKLFRDFVFHQCCPDDGAPIVDMEHVLSCLNKVDVGSSEKILLSSRNNKDMFVVSYADIQRCVYVCVVTSQEDANTPDLT